MLICILPKDEFEIAYADYSKQTASTATSVAYIAPSLTPRGRRSVLNTYSYRSFTQTQILLSESTMSTLIHTRSWIPVLLFVSQFFLCSQIVRLLTVSLRASRHV